MEDLEQLLNESKLNPIRDQIPKDKIEKSPYSSKNLQRANANIKFYDFLKKIGLIVESEMSEENVTFNTKSELYRLIKDPESKLDHPVITFAVKKRITPDGFSYKPTMKENLTAGGEINSMRFDYYVQFDFFSDQYEQANNIMEKFEYLMYAYSSYLKGQGIVEYHFHEQIESDEYNIFREKVNVLSLIYRVQEERQMVIAKEEVQNHILKLTASVKGEEQNKINIYED